ncbi:hypothetical protein [Pedococcus soli]
MSSLKFTTTTPVTRNDQTISFTGVLKPSGGLVNLEKSKDGTTWTIAQRGVKSGADGAFKTSVKGTPAGTWHFRAGVEATSLATSADSSAVKVIVEDYKAAGAKYLAIISELNGTINASNDAVNAYNANNSSANERAVRATDAAESSAAGSAAKALRAYKGWPRQVAPIVEAMAKSLVLESDALNLMAKAAGIDERNALYPMADSAHLEGNKAAATIREALGLPQRPAN